jgi:hypothetical protein
MAFLNPTFLWFMIGGSIPIIIHLLHRQKYRRVRWAAMEFLLQALKKTQRRLQLENLILLLLRILIMILLALAISRPFFREAPLEAMAQSDTHHIYVIDNSYSMAHKKAQKSAFDLAKEACLMQFDGIRKLSEEDKFTILLMSNYPETWLATSNKKEFVRRSIQDVKLSHYGSSAMLTFQLIADTVAKSRNALKKITIFTDFQRCGWDPGEKQQVEKFQALLKDLSKREDVKIAMMDLGAAETDNRAIVDLRVEQKVIATRRTTNFGIDIQNWSASSFPSVVVTLTIDGSALPQKTTPLPANTMTTVNFAYEFLEPGPHFVEAAIEPDFVDVDDKRCLALDVKDGLRGLLVDGEPGQKRWESETDYLRTALDPSGAGRFFKLDVKTTELFTGEQLEVYDFVVLANVQSLTNDKVEKLEAYVQSGGGLFISMGGRVDKVSWNEHFYKKGQGLFPGELIEVAGTGPDVEPRIPLRMNHINYDHKMFAVFKKGLQHAPRDLIFYQYYKLDKVLPEHMVADYDDATGTPVVMDKPYGEGRVLAFNNSIDGDWNAGIPGRPPYLPLMISAMEHLSARPLNRRNLMIGDPIVHVMPAAQYQEKFLLETPTEGQLTIAPAAPKGDEKFVRVVYPLPRSTDRKPEDKKPLDNEGLKFSGRYALRTVREDDKPVSFFACNVPPRVPSPEELARAEGNLERIGKDELMQRYPDFKFVVTGEKNTAGSVDIQKDPSHLWKYLLYLLAGFLVIESILAWVFGRSKQ